jgi:hypothetical protein
MGNAARQYDIVPPFPQPGRETCRPDRGELEDSEITRSQGMTVRDSVF